VSRSIEHPGQFSSGTTLKKWSVFNRRQQGSGLNWQMRSWAAKNTPALPT